MFGLKLVQVGAILRSRPSTSLRPFDSLEVLDHLCDAVFFISNPLGAIFIGQQLEELLEPRSSRFLIGDRVGEFLILNGIGCGPKLLQHKRIAGLFGRLLEQCRSLGILRSFDFGEPEQQLFEFLVAFGKLRLTLHQIRCLGEATWSQKKNRNERDSSKKVVRHGFTQEGRGRGLCNTTQAVVARLVCVLFPYRFSTSLALRSSFDRDQESHCSSQGRAFFPAPH